MVTRILQSTLDVALEAAPWLVLGLVVAGLIYSFLPPSRVSKWLGGHGLGAIVKAALLGAPLPLCSCGVLPVAVGLRKAGASRGATASFMVSTPETGVDSVSITYALMGPVFAITRPIAAIASAMITGLLVEWFGAGRIAPGDVRLAVAGPKRSCCSEADRVEAASDDCCQAGGGRDSEAAPGSFAARLGEGQRYAATRLIDDLSKWLIIGIVVAGVMNALIAPDALAEWGAGPAAYAVMLLIGLPMYVCATASTPIAASMLFAGVSPGPVLVFLMAGPATNIATLGVLKRELGARSIAPYLIGVGGVAVACGLALDALFRNAAFTLPAHLDHEHAVAPLWLAWLCLGWLCFIALKPLRGAVFRAVGLEKATAVGRDHKHGDEAGCGEHVDPMAEACCSQSR